MTFKEWAEKAEAALPAIAEYAKGYDMTINPDAAILYLQEGNYITVWSILEAIWEDLPDTPEIRTATFFTLCDLIAEYPREEGH